MDLFQDLNREGLTILVVTHEHDIAERTHRTIVLRDGEIVPADATSLALDLPLQAAPS